MALYPERALGAHPAVPPRPGAGRLAAPRGDGATSPSSCGVTPAEVRGTATFYDMLHTEPVGRYVVAVCTNIACMLGGALRAARARRGARSACGRAARRPTACSRSKRPSAWPTATGRRACRSTTASSGAQTPEGFDALVDDLRAGRLDDDGAAARHARAGAAQRRPAGRPVAIVASGPPWPRPGGRAAGRRRRGAEA